MVARVFWVIARMCFFYCFEVTMIFCPINKACVKVNMHVLFFIGHEHCSGLTLRPDLPGGPDNP